MGAEEDVERLLTRCRAYPDAIERALQAIPRIRGQPGGGSKTSSSASIAGSPSRGSSCWDPTVYPGVLLVAGRAGPAPPRAAAPGGGPRGRRGLRPARRPRGPSGPGSGRGASAVSESTPRGLAPILATDPLAPLAARVDRRIARPRPPARAPRPPGRAPTTLPTWTAPRIDLRHRAGAAHRRGARRDAVSSGRVHPTHPCYARIGTRAGRTGGKCEDMGSKLFVGGLSWNTHRRLPSYRVRNLWCRSRSTRDSGQGHRAKPWIRLCHVRDLGSGSRSDDQDGWRHARWAHHPRQRG